MKQRIENIEFLDLVSGIKALEYKEQVSDYLELYAELQDNNKVKSSIIKVLDDNCYRLRLAYFGRFV